MSLTRRTFLHATAAGIAGFSNGAMSNGSLNAAKPSQPTPRSLAGEVGITTSSLSGHLAARPAAGKITLLELPRILRNELDMRVIDLNTTVFPSTTPAYLDKFRAAADKASCLLTNLKLNQRGLNMNSPDKNVREKALRTYKRSIDVVAHLGLKWARPLPRKPRPDMKIHIDSYRRLADYAAKRNIRMLVENYGWMQSDPQSVVKLIKAVDRNLAASPDIGNWNSNAIRYRGLAATFPLAVTCDFKARRLGPHGEHTLYDLERCFRIGWKAGFRGPWCLEHAHKDRKTLFRELALLRDMLRRWMKQAG